MSKSFKISTQPETFHVQIRSAHVKAGNENKAPDTYGVTPLMHAVLDSQNSEMIPALLKAGADVLKEKLLASGMQSE